MYNNKVIKKSTIKSTLIERSKILCIKFKFIFYTSEKVFKGNIKDFC